MNQKFNDNNIYPAFMIMFEQMGKEFEHCEENPGLYCHAAICNKRFMVTYYLRINNHPVATAVVTNDCMIDGIPSFNLLYAVDQAYWQLGYGTMIVEKVIDQFRIDMKKARTKPNLKNLYLTTYVDINNLVSQKISRKCLSSEFTIIKDSISKQPQYYYKRLLDI